MNDPTTPQKNPWLWPLRALIILLIVVLGGVILAIALSGCSSTVPATTEQTVEPTPPLPDPFIVQFDEPYVYDDGVTITVSQPTEFELSPTAEVEGTQRAHQLVWKISVLNNSTEDFTPQVFPKVWSGEFMDSLIKDANNPVGDITYQPDGTVLAPGEQYDFLIAYSVDDLDALKVLVYAEMDRDTITFTNILP